MTPISRHDIRTKIYNKIASQLSSKIVFVARDHNLINDIDQKMNILQDYLIIKII